MTASEHLSSTQKIRATLHRDVQAICTETCHFLGLEISKPAMEIVAELVYKKLSVYGTDLEAFAKHAKRATITTEDVKLLVRRCPSLKTQLDAISPAAPVPKEKKRKTIAGRQSETPTPKAKESEIQTSKSKEPESFFSKPKETDAHFSKQKDPETLFSKQKDPETLFSKQKETETFFSKHEPETASTPTKKVKMDINIKQKKSITVIDDLIDLTD